MSKAECLLLQVSVWRAFAGASCIALSLFFAPQAFSQDQQTQVRAHVNRGNQLLSRRMFKDAIAAYEDALKLDPANPIAKSNIVETYNNWGILYYNQRKYADAMKQWQKAVDLDPQHGNARRNIAVLKQLADREQISLDEEQKAPEGPPPLSRKAPGKDKDDDTAGVSASVMLQGGVSTKPPAEADNIPGVQATILSPGAAGGAAGSSTQWVPGGEGGTVTPGSRQQSELFPSTPDQYPEQLPWSQRASRTGAAGATTSPAVQPQVAPPPAPTMTFSAPAAPVAPVSPVAPAAKGGSIEEQLAAVELKVYGQKQQDLTVMQRLEKLEKDSSGSIQPGTIMDRLSNLKKSFGL